jgi:hypothetical protein
MASANFTNFCRDLLTGASYILDGDMRVMLVSSVPSESNLDSWTVRSDVTNEVTGTGYSAGGINQPCTVETLNTTSNYQEVTYTDIVNGWTGASVTALGAIIYVSTGSAATDPLLHFIDFNGSQSCVLGNISITYTGTFRINRAA